MSVGRTELYPGYSISRVIKGGWHLAGGHGHIDKGQAIADMCSFVEAGITTFDCADIYTGVEELIGAFIKHHAEAFNSGELPPVQVHTKFVPDYGSLANLTQDDITRIIDRSLSRLGVERLDLVQFHWWDYGVPGYVEAAAHLAALQREGKIRHIGVTNFDAKHLKEILEAGVPVRSHQVQYSVLDHRAENDLLELSKANSIQFLCYGVVAGGFLSDRYLNAPDPSQPLENRSLTKYRLIIDEFGGYDHFQRCLHTLKGIANKYGVGLAEVAMKYILDKEMVGAIIVGARNVNHLRRFDLLNQFELDEEDRDEIALHVDNAQGPHGPFYALERDKEGKHGRIMKYNLNKD